MPIHYRETQYGFEYGAANVTRAFRDEKQGYVGIELQTPRSRVILYVTKTGKVRVYKYGEEMTI